MLTHKIFHLDNAEERDQYYLAMNNYLASYSAELNTQSIRISNQEEFENFIKNNSDFNLDFNGYNLDNIQGWRYGEVGVWASNFLAWKAFKESEADYGMFMEDDIMFEPDFMEVLNEYMSELPENWDAFFFAVPPGQFPKYYEQGADIGMPNVSRVYQDHWMLCYLLSKNGVNKALEYTKRGINLPLDWYFFRQKSLFNSFAVKPTSKFVCFGSPTETSFQYQERKVMRIDS